MKKFSLIALLFPVILLLENCKKDTVYGSATSTSLMIARVKDTTFYTDTVTASLTYDAATKSKTFTCLGMKDSKQIALSITKNDITSSFSSFPLGTYIVDSTANISLALLSPQRNAEGNTVYAPNGVVKPGSGTIIVSAVDSVKNEITGTFSFTTLKNNYDSNGNVTSVTIATVTGGGFNAVPFMFTTK